MLGKLRVVVLILGSLALVNAQTDRGVIEGAVTDTSGAAVPSARIQVVRIGTNAIWSVTSNEVGRYYVPSLPLGEYRVVVQKEGFTTIAREPIEIRSQTNARIDIILQLGSISQTVEVTGEAPLLNTADTTTSASLTTKYIEELPLIAFGSKADIASYMKYMPGAESTGNAGGGPTVNGSQNATSEVFVDGAPASAGVGRGSINETGAAVSHYGEFNIVTNSFSAEYGRTGAWFYSVTIKSGTNTPHGSVYDNFVNDALNARDFFQARRQIYRQNNGGYTLGGPVYIPKVYDGRNRTFFFFGHDLFYSRGAQSGTLLTIPSQALRQGDFSNYKNSAGSIIPIFDPASAVAAGTRLHFPENRIPLSQISKASQNIVALMPAPDLPSQSANWRNRTGANPKFNIFSITAKVDHSFSDAHKLSISYGDEYRPRTIAGRGWGADSPLEGLQLQPLHSRTGRVSYDAIIRPSLINRFTFGIDRYLNPAFAATAGQDWNNKLGIRGLPYDIGSFPTVLFSGGTDSPIQIGEVQWSNLGAGRCSYLDTLTWLKGHHTLKFGVNLWREYRNDNAKANGSGIWTYTNTVTSQPGASQYAQWGSSVASFLLGAPGTAYTRGPTSLSSRLPYQALFIQDDWRATSKLSVSLGLRWENNTPPYDKYDRLAIFNPDTQNPGAGNRPGALAFAGSGTGTINARTTVKAWHKGFSPRVGYVYQLTSKLVMRSSFGIFYAAPSLNALSYQGFGIQATSSSPNGYTPAYLWDNSFPSFNQQLTLDPAQVNGQVVHWYAPDYARNPQILTWTSGFQYQVSPHILLDATYIGQHSTHLETSFLGNPNVLDPAYLSLGSLLTQRIDSSAAIAAGIKSPWPGFENSPLNTVGQALRPYPQYLDVYNLGGKVGNARFNSLQVRATKRFSHGLTFMTSYTWSKTLTNVPRVNIDVKGALTPNSVQTPYSRAQEVTVSELTLPHDFRMSFSYELPFGSGKTLLNRRGIVDRLVGGWQVIGFVQRASGAALSITGSNNLSNLGIGTKRANLAGGVPLTVSTDMGDFEPATDRYINRNAFSAPASFSLGNSPRTMDWLRGWPLHSESASVNKAFVFREAITMRFGVDLDNPFNLVRWNNPVTNVSASNFGAVTASASGRRIQLTMLVQF